MSSYQWTDTDSDESSGRLSESVGFSVFREGSGRPPMRDTWIYSTGWGELRLMVVIATFMVILVALLAGTWLLLHRTVLPCSDRLSDIFGSCASGFGR